MAWTARPALIGPICSRWRTSAGRLFQPFQRLGGERVRRQHGHEGGLGLGLAIVRAIAVAHGADITAHARPEGGLDITVTFPAPSG